jgi:hypothetical protein
MCHPRPEPWSYLKTLCGGGYPTKQILYLDVQPDPGNCIGGCPSNDPSQAKISTIAKRTNTLDIDDNIEASPSSSKI